MPFPRHLLRRMSTRQQLCIRWDEAVEALSFWWRSTVCRVRGHSAPVQRFKCVTCSRCGVVLP